MIAKKMPTINIQGVPHAYELFSPTPNAKSSNPVLIFIHGWLLSRHYWQPLIEKLVPQYPCLIYDLRGFGDSQPQETAKTQLQYASFIADYHHSFSQLNQNPSSSPYSLAAYAHDLKILLQKLEIEQAWLIGHSLGGSIALWGAYFCPKIIKGTICLNSGGGIYLKEEFERFRSAGQQLVKRRPRWLCFVPLMDLLFARLTVCHPLERRWGKQRIKDFLKAHQETAIGALLESTTESEVHLLPQIVSHLQQPTYFIAGEKDFVMESNMFVI